MNTLAIFVLIIAAVVAKPRPGQHVSVNQDTLGNYNLNYAIGGISRVENRDLNGNVAGGYAYIDPHGIERRIEFTSGVHGYNAIGTDIPLPVQDTPEVAHAKAAHLNVLHAAYLAAPPQPLEIESPHFLPLAHHAPLARAFPVAHAPALHQFAHEPLVGAFPVAHAPAFHQALVHGAIPDTPEVAAARAEHLAAHAAAAHGNFPLF